MDPCSYSTWLEIDLGAIRNNVSALQVLSGCPVMAVIKANAYGHGAIPVAQAVVEAGAAWCGVSRLEEALALRQAGLVGSILVLGYTPPDRAPLAIANRVSLTVYDPALVAKYVAYAQDGLGDLRVHVKIETGMGRLGIAYEKAADFIFSLNRQPGLKIEGIFTHFARADEPEASATRLQINRFQAVLDAINAQGIYPAWVHASNSAGTIYHQDGRFNLVRAGVAIYGLHPSAAAPLPGNFLPALSWKTRLTSIKDLPAGYGISYGSHYLTSKVERIGVIPVGYADGFRRVDNQEVLLNGQIVRVVGRVCMDQCMLQIDKLPLANLEDEVVILGRQGSQVISAEDIARRWGTNNYEVVCGLAARLPRVYLNSSGKELNSNFS
jgi:alanine racemase